MLTIVNAPSPAGPLATGLPLRLLTASRFTASRLTANRFTANRLTASLFVASRAAAGAASATIAIALSANAHPARFFIASLLLSSHQTPSRRPWPRLRSPRSDIQQHRVPELARSVLRAGRFSQPAPEPRALGCQLLQAHFLRNPGVRDADGAGLVPRRLESHAGRGGLRVGRLDADPVENVDQHPVARGAMPAAIVGPDQSDAGLVER